LLGCSPTPQSWALRKSLFPPEKSREAFDYILQHWERHGYGPWATFEKASGRYVGHIGLEYIEDWPFEHKTEVGFVVASDLWNRGFATEAAQASLRHGFDVAGLSRIISTTFDAYIAGSVIGGVLPCSFVSIWASCRSQQARLAVRRGLPVHRMAVLACPEVRE
jgi:hypothetical protein